MKTSVYIVGITILCTVALIMGLVAACAQKPAPTTTPATATTTVPTTATTTAPTVSEGTYTLTFSFVDWKLNTSDRMYGEGGVLQRLLWERSGGRIKLNIVHDMFGSIDQTPAILEGRADMGNAPIVYNAETYPVFSWAELPGIFDLNSNDAAHEEIAAIDDPGMQDIYDKALRDIGAVFLSQSWWCTGNNLFTDKKVTSVADLKGLKVRTASRVGGMAFEALGAKAVSMPWGEITSSLMTGIIDGVQASVPDGVGWIGLTFVKYIIPLPVGPGWSEFIIINKNKFDSLPPDIQAVLKDVGRTMIRTFSADAYGARQAPSEDAAKGYGIEFITWTPEEIAKANKLLEPVVTDWLKIAGPYGQQVLSIARDVVAKYKAMPLYPK